MLHASVAVQTADRASGDILTGGDTYCSGEVVNGGRGEGGEGGREGKGTGKPLSAFRFPLLPARFSFFFGGGGGSRYCGGVVVGVVM